ncbi:Diaminopimelate decarboxylase [Salinivirga cyanobacteriivorans]|uniref:Diaminopimelate decarboxylase n=1 Tax=Salinivirga cyanobacteriivorans TaxID=1307839 RepID=A0A0S2HY03_9BACT|nr:diaminopimelate decarboxylase [Salinivirga cyanobacteriivorans]ALO14888.1 Diaminopimelate decarboxylase [Salinivirga cyanobacteriivorans]
MENKNLWRQFSTQETPFYLYDFNVLRKVLVEATKWSSRFGYKLHYALKANANPELLNVIRQYGIGADCVSGNEVKHAVNCGFHSHDVVFAGVGKTDEEISLALKTRIFSFNVESCQELDVINKLAQDEGTKARVAIRVNPDVNPYTHEYISTGQSRNKFGIPHAELKSVLSKIERMKYVQFMGLHFHIGSQITQMSVFRELCQRVNIIQKEIESMGYEIPHLNLGGGLGINYDDEAIQMPDFETYFKVFYQTLDRRAGQQIHFEPGRSLVAASGTLITKVLYVKETPGEELAIVDAGMTELIRPALYQSYHPISNLSSDEDREHYAVAGPICESSDFFTHKVLLPRVKRNHLLAIKQVGAYGEVMSSRYNLRQGVRRYHVDNERKTETGKEICTLERTS